MSQRMSLCGILVLSAFLFASAAEPSIHKVVDSTITGTVSFKPALQSFTDYTTGNLLIRDLRTGEVRVLVRAQAEEGADWSAITRDGQSVAYTWYASNGATELRVVGTDGSAPRVVLRDPEVEYVEPHDWTPDGTQILTHLVFRGWRTAIALVSVEHGSVRKLKSFEFRPWGRRMCVSPDGLLIAYDTPQAATTADRDIFLLRTDGTGEIRLVDHPANDIVLGWFSDGDLLFASNRSGRWNAYRVAVSGMAPEKKPSLLKEGLTPDLSQYGFERDQTYVRGLGFTSDGSFYFGFSDWENDAYLAELDAQGKVAKPPHKIADLLAFKSSVAWSRDGKKLALFTWHGWEPYSLLLRVRSVAAGKERRFALAMTRMLGNAIRPSWSPDGRYLVAAGGDGGSRRGILRIDAETGETTPVTVSTTCPPECVEWPVWLSNQQVAFVRCSRDSANELVHSIISHDLRTGSERKLYQAGMSDRLSHLVISPDRKSLAFVRSHAKHQTRAINILSLADGSDGEIYQVKGPELIFDLAWTPDGKQIIFGTGIGGSFGTDMTGDMSFAIWRITANGGQPERLGLSMDGVELYGISVHPDGRRIAFTAGTPLRAGLWRLQGLSDTESQELGAKSSVTLRKIAELEGATGSGLTAFASICPDGPYIAFIADVEGDQVFLLDLQTGSRRQLTWGPGEAGDSAIISPDCKQVVYDASASEHPELRLIGTDGSKPRTLFRAGGLLLLQPHAWSADGNYILFDLVREDLTYQIGLVAVADGSVRIIATRTLKTLNGRKPWAKLALSPDGLYVAYEYPPQGDTPQRRVLLLSADGRQERVLVREARDSRLLGWTPDGKSVVYASVHDGKWNVWAIEVEGGAPKNPHKLVAADVGKISLSLGFTRDGSFCYAAPPAGNDLYLTSLSPGETKLETPEKVATRLAIASSPAWSPDGGRLAYAYGFGNRLDPFRIAIRSASTGDERHLSLETLARFGGHSFQPQWSPDGRSLLGVGRDPRYSGPGRDSEGIYRVDLASGKTEPIVRTKQICWWDCVEWATWASDGRIFFVRWQPAPRHIVALDPTTGREVGIYRPASAADISRLAVSPDGKQLAFVWRDNDSGESALKLVLTHGSEARNLVTAKKPVTISWPAWTPDSRQIIYATETTGAEGRLEFWRVSADKGDPQNLGLAMPGVKCDGLSVHPEGHRIAFTAGTPMRSEVWVLENLLPALKTAK